MPLFFFRFQLKWLIFSIVSSEKIEVFFEKKKLAKSLPSGAKKKRELWLCVKKKCYMRLASFDFDLIKNLMRKVMSDHVAIYERTFIFFVIWKIEKQSSG